MGELVHKGLFLNAGVQELKNSNTPNFLTHLILSSVIVLSVVLFQNKCPVPNYCPITNISTAVFFIDSRCLK
jgi:hypothetical protein